MDGSPPLAETQWYSICLPNGPCLTCAAGVVDPTQDIPRGTEYHGTVSFKDYGKDPSGAPGTQSWQLFPVDISQSIYIIRPQAYLTKLSLHYTSSNGLEVSNKNDGNYLWGVSVEGSGLTLIDPKDSNLALSFTGGTASLANFDTTDVSLKSFVINPLGAVNDEIFSTVDPSIATSAPTQQQQQQQPQTQSPSLSEQAAAQTPKSPQTFTNPENGVVTVSSDIDVTATVDLSPSHSTSTSTKNFTTSVTYPPKPTKDQSSPLPSPPPPPPVPPPTPQPTSGAAKDTPNHIGAAVGGAIGGLAAFLMLGLAAVIFLKRRRIRIAARSKSTGYTHRPHDPGFAVAELDAVDTALPYRELGNTGIVEVCGESKPTELPTSGLWYPRDKKRVIAK